MRVARGPDGTHGFVLWRSSRATGGGDYKQLASVVRKGADWLCSDFAIGLMAFLLVILFLLSFLWLGVAAGQTRDRPYGSGGAATH